jgi:hypothetical protein
VTRKFRQTGMRALRQGKGGFVTYAFAAYADKKNPQRS